MTGGFGNTQFYVAVFKQRYHLKFYSYAEETIRS